MVLLVRVEVVTVNAHRVDVPGLSVVRGGHPAVTRTIQSDGVLEVEVCIAKVDGHILPGVCGEGAAGVEVAFVAGVDVGGVDCFVYTNQHLTIKDREEGVPSAWCEISFPLTETCWIILLLAWSTVMVKSSCESFGTGT